MPTCHSAKLDGQSGPISDTLEIMFDWADELDVAADELEGCIFARQAGLDGGQWAPKTCADSNPWQ